MARIFENVALGDGAVVDETATIGLPPGGVADGELPTVIGRGRGHPIACGRVRRHDDRRTASALGTARSFARATCWATMSRSGTNAALEFGNRVGDRVRIHTGCFLENCVVEDDVFLGPHVVFTDDPHPACPRYRDCVGGATVRRQVEHRRERRPSCRASRSARGASIGAGSVVAGECPAGVVVAGNPARVVKKVEELVCWPGFFERPYVWRDAQLTSTAVPFVDLARMHAPDPRGHRRGGRRRRRFGRVHPRARTSMRSSASGRRTAMSSTRSA